MSRVGLLLLLWLAALASHAEVETVEILYRDLDVDGSAYTSRILVHGEGLRMDYGRDDDDYVLFDRPDGKVYAVSVQGRSVTVIPSGKPLYDWPEGWQLEVSESNRAGNLAREVRLNGTLCAEFKSADSLPHESRMLAALARALAANQASTWRATPQELLDPCFLALEVHEAGIAYGGGLLLAARYADGRSRTYRQHGLKPVDAALFQIPEDFRRFEMQRTP